MAAKVRALERGKSMVFFPGEEDKTAENCREGRQTVVWGFRPY
jgi:hypothetical protein